MHLNFEFKARVNDLVTLEEKLKTLGPCFGGEDHQTGTYFNVPNGRLKLREGNIENALIQYQRSNTAGAKRADIVLYRHQPDKDLKQALEAALGIKVIVVKRRKIYFIENVKFHFDTVEHLGFFIEVEAIDEDGSIGIQKLREQCSFYSSFFGVLPQSYVAGSYSDLLLELPG
jgi:predicted adenylyl cyclase CyaB